MQFALVNGTRSRPQPGVRGTCPICGQSALSKCGSQLMWHWAHHGRRHCDPWWENETEWHRAWKSSFPETMQEIVHFDEVTGEKHVADVKTARGLIIELQHSAMPLEEMRSREHFYKNMIWIVDGKPFTNQFELVPHLLPHPESKLLEDVVFFHPLANAFWRRSESTPDSSMVEMHRADKIAQEIAADYRGHHFFCWKRPREVWYSATAPVFIDFGGKELFRLGRYRPSTQWVAQRISKQALIEKNGGIYSAFSGGG
ncbi:MAG: hypothetical protein IT473_09385 [Lysobacter sp.]|nr:hypothetical protein [Lysobacter sp.]